MSDGQIARPPTWPGWPHMLRWEVLGIWSAKAVLHVS
jgi:hypothetical protein